MSDTKETARGTEGRSVRPLTAAARRALAEATARRAELDARLAGRPKELAGRDGPDPVRYGDWEVRGLASDF